MRGAARASASTSARSTSTPRSPPTCSTRPSRSYLLEDLLLRYVGLELRRRRRPAPRARSTSTATAADLPSETGRTAAGRRPAGAGASPTRSTAQGLRDAVRRRSSCRSSGCWPAWRTSASASTSPYLARAATTSSATECDELEQRDPGGGRRRVQRQLHAAAAHDPVRQARPGAAEEDEDRASRPTPQSLEKLARPAPDHRAPAALPRGREAAVDLRRGPARRGRPPTAASTPRSTRPWPAPAGSSSDQPNLHNIPVRTEEGRAVPAGVRPRRRAASCSSPTTTRSSCG